MKTIKLSFGIICTLFLLITVQSCSDDTCTETRTLYVWNPVYKDTDAIRKEFAIEAPKALANPGKIYYYNQHIFISEPSEGIHIIDNTDPANPTPVNFIKIPGTKDMAVKNGRLYADNYIDLLTIDISDLSDPTLTSRTENVFNDYALHQDLGYLIKYERSLETQEIDCNNEIYYGGWGRCNACSGREFSTSILADASFSNAPRGAAFQSSVPTNTTGIGGSFARFTIANGHLYTVDQSDLRVFDLINCDRPNFLNNTSIGWGIETIFPLGNNLFIGSNNGMFIYDITNGSTPTQLSQFQHARACDPVYVSDTKAYVTLRSGSACNGFVNQLDVIDVTELTNPRLIISHPMDNPHGLSVRGTDLFICEGEFGLKVFDRSSDTQISNNLLSSVPNLHAYDIITLSTNLAMIIGQDGLYQYDISNTQQLAEVSRITINRQ